MSHLGREKIEQDKKIHYLMDNHFFLKNQQRLLF